MDFLRLFCVRHGQTATHRGYVFNGWTDVDLSDEGRRQLDEAAEALGTLPFDGVWSSDLRRAAYGARALAAKAGMEPIVERRFRELNFGDCEALPFKEIQARYPKLAEELSSPQGGDFSFPNGESAGSFRERIGQALAALRERHPTGRVALFSHAGVGRAILANLLGLDYQGMWAMEQDYASLNVIDVFPGGGLRIRLVNGYLGPEGYHRPGPGRSRLLVEPD